MFSTFSFDCIPTNGIAQTSCGTAFYAGCMTTPCTGTNISCIVNCSCPTFNGPYQVGQNDQACSLGGSLVWSAAYAPPTPTPAPTPTPVVATPSAGVHLQAATAPSPTACLPDAPGGYGCPLYTNSTVYHRIVVSIALPFARNTTVASPRGAYRWAIPVTRLCVPTNAPTAIWSARPVTAYPSAIFRKSSRPKRPHHAVVAQASSPVVPGGDSIDQQGNL